MGIDCKIYLPAKARLHDVADVIGLLRGHRATWDATQRFIIVDGVLTRPSNVSECADIIIGDARFLYHFEFGDHGERGIMPRSNPANIALAKGLVDFFGGRVDFNDGDDIECDYFVEEQPDINATNGDAWMRLQNRKMAVRAGDPRTYRFPLGLIDGKEVWEGDVIYAPDGTSCTATNQVCFDPRIAVWSLTPPKPKTALGEVIHKNIAEIQSGRDRQSWAEGLILQMPCSHAGRNSWLLNYGISDEAKELRENHPNKPKWDTHYRAAETTGAVSSKPKTVMVELSEEDADLVLHIITCAAIWKRKALEQPK